MSKPEKIKSDKPKLDLFSVLDKFSTINIDYFNKLSDDDKKSLAPVVIMRWLSGTKDKTQILNINHFVNPVVFNMYSHQDLLFKLMMASCSGKSQRFKWLKRNTTSKKPISIEIIKNYYKCSTREAKNYLAIHSVDDLIIMIEELGEDSALIDKLKKE